MDNLTYIIYVTIILITIFFIILAITVFTSGRNTLQQCKPGQCVTNIFSGETDCSTLNFDPTFQVCNTQGQCDNNRTPCVIQDPKLGSSCPSFPGFTGLCTSGSPCGCTGRVYCPDFATVYFTQKTISESNFTNSGSSANLNVFIQEDSWTDDANFSRADLPLSTGIFGSTATNNVCSLSKSNLNQAFPAFTKTSGTTNQSCISGTLTLNSSDSLFYCMNFPLTCQSPQIPTRNLDGTFVCR